MSVGDVARTMLPEPVVEFPKAVTVPETGSVRVVAPEVVKVMSFAPIFNVLVSVPANVIELEAVKVLPSAIVNVDPVAGAVIATLLMLAAVATPNAGVTKAGEVAKTLFPVPVAVFQDIAPALFCNAFKPTVDVTAVSVSKVLAARIEPKATVFKLVPPFTRGNTPVT